MYRVGNCREISLKESVHADNVDDFVLFSATLYIAFVDTSKNMYLINGFGRHL